jgi:hypothetical protein
MHLIVPFIVRKLIAQVPDASIRAVAGAGWPGRCTRC